MTSLYNPKRTSTATAKVLAVDDRKENLLALEAILHRLPVEVISVTSGEDALKRLLTDNYAVILLDAQMPGMDGFETAGHIKQRERTRHIPILLLTAADYDPHLAFRGYQAGAVDYITKPFDPWVLQSKVAVFVDLWRLTTAQTQQAARYAAAAEAINDALTMLAPPTPTDPAARDALLDRLRARLTAVHHLTQ
ncbi:MAG TPA: response regulator [Pseudonocardiaceae bacterium]|nr:response regulator [Pseudonocardiaceae bacterium]